jgi:TolB protein
MGRRLLICGAWSGAGRRAGITAVLTLAACLAAVTSLPAAGAHAARRQVSEPSFLVQPSSARAVGQPRTLFAGSRWIYSFALGAHRITWISRAHGRRHCEMFVRTLRNGRTVSAPVPSAGCGVTPPPDFAPQAPVLADGVAAWVTRSGCGNSECFWKIATITGGEAKARTVENADFGCPGRPACLFPHRVGKATAPVPPPFPRPSLAGKGSLLVYSAGGSSVDQIQRIVGRHAVPFAVLPGLGDGGGIESLAVGGGAVEVDSTVVDAGDGCGCLESPAWSPDGSQIAYLHTTPQSTTPAVMNADGSGRHDLAAPAAGYETSLSWSPDGKQIAYGDADGKVVVAHADGSGATVLGQGYDPAWSPDGSRVAFASAGCNNTTAAISVMNPDGTNIHQVASFTPGPTCLGKGIAWSPDGSRIAFSFASSSGSWVLEMMNADGTDVHQLGTNTVGDEPAWSPDGSQIVFHVADSGSIDSGLKLIGANGSGLRQLTLGPDDHPSWSPDGQTIVFGSERNNPYGPYGLPELYLIDPDGSDLRPLSFTKPATFESQTTFYSAKGTLLPSLPGVPTLAGNIAAVGSTNPSGSHEITLFDATTGGRLAMVQVGTGNAPFAVSGADAHWVVFHVGRAISALNASSHQLVRLTTAPARPIDLCVSGRRVAWAENSNGYGRIRTMDLPR